MNQQITTIQRLSLIRNLYLIGINQSYKSEPFSGFSILNFHDCVELFLQLSAEEVKVKTDDTKFIAYWDLFLEKEISLPYKESMRKLNKARGNLKHGGLIPSKFDIELFRSTTTEFLEESCLLIFKIKLKDISIIDYINFDKTKEYLKLAEKEFDNGNKTEIINYLALSFFYLLNDYEELVKNKFNFSPFSFGESVVSHNLHEVSKYSRNTYECLESLSRSVGDMQYALRIISFGIDYIKCIKFHSIIPRVYFTLGKKPVVMTIDKIEIGLISFEFCKNFIIESAFKFQENDFNRD